MGETNQARRGRAEAALVRLRALLKDVRERTCDPTAFAGELAEVHEAWADWLHPENATETATEDDTTEGLPRWQYDAAALTLERLELYPGGELLELLQPFIWEITKRAVVESTELLAERGFCNFTFHRSVPEFRQDGTCEDCGEPASAHVLAPVCPRSDERGDGVDDDALDRVRFGLEQTDARTIARDEPQVPHLGMPAVVGVAARRELDRLLVFGDHRMTNAGAEPIWFRNRLGEVLRLEPGETYQFPRDAHWPWRFIGIGPEAAPTCPDEAPRGLGVSRKPPPD